MLNLDEIVVNESRTPPVLFCTSVCSTAHSTSGNAFELSKCEITGRNANLTQLLRQEHHVLQGPLSLWALLSVLGDVGFFANPVPFCWVTQG